MNEVAGDASSDGRKRRAKTTPKGPSRLKKQKSVRALTDCCRPTEGHWDKMFPQLPHDAWLSQVNASEQAQE